MLMGLVFVVNPGVVSACSCVPFTKPQLVENASVIFTGTVTGASGAFPFGLGCTRSSADPIVVTFEVESLYKGDAPRQLAVSTVVGGASCGYEFQNGKRYTVFATGTRDKLETNLCRGNVEGAIAPAEYGLGAGRPPS
jgi:hypothetical protein